MKRFFRISLISLIVLLLVLAITVSITMWLVFTPERLTPILRKQTEKHLPYQTSIGEADLTFFSTFPRLGIKLTKFTVISPFAEAISDTLVNIDQLTGAIDARKYWKNNDIVVEKLILTGGYANVFSDSLGVTNYDLFLSEEVAETEETEEGELSLVNLDKIVLDDIKLSYIDLASGINASVEKLKASLSGNLDADLVEVNVNVDDAGVSFSDKEEQYLRNARISCQIPAKVTLSNQRVELEEALFSLNGLEISLTGSIENDLSSGNIITDINYELSSWEVENIMALIPGKYISGTGINHISGKIFSHGNFEGIYNDSLMPLADISFQIEDGYVDYEELPFPLSGLKGDIHLFGDMNNEQASWLRIDHFEARTPRSAFKTKGLVNDILADMHCDLISEADVFVDEFAVFIPDTLDMNLNGRIKAELETDFLLSQLTEMELEKIKISGLASLYDFTLEYDSMALQTNYSRIEFSLPSADPFKPNTTFASVTVDSDELSASEIESYSANLNKSRIYLEMSDVRDTTVIPHLYCTYRIDSLRADMDTIHISMLKPYGNVYVSPLINAPGLPSLEVAFSSFDLNADAGEDSLTIEDILLNTSVSNDTAQEDVFLQWPAIGSLNMKNAMISLSTLSEAVEIPAIKMDFDPETFNIHDSRLNIDRSDYELKGTVNNVLSYFRGDSILRADFNFFSNITDLNQLMYLTSGIGAEDESMDTIPSLPEAEDSISEPYMVPLGIEVRLAARVNELITAADTARNIKGDVLINDGILVLDDLMFTTPAADMQLTAMYRTPRKNHIYVGMDYHMLDIEIGRLLQMIPDIDTLMPMLRSFAGTGEFHIAVETYLDSAYNVKMSTLRGASSIVGHDLVLMDGETFSEIAKKLRFSRKAENRVDSLSAEFTIFREEIDIYPFLIVMDRYKAVVGGRHNLDMSFDYHISLVESPLPLRLGIDIDGNLEDLRYRPVAPKYAELYRPTSRKAVESQQIQLRQLIREALVRKVKESEAMDSNPVDN